MLTGMETMAVLALISKDSDNTKTNHKHVEYCRNCGKPFVTDNAREFCSYDCQKSA